MKYIKDCGWVLYEKRELIPIKIFPFSMFPIPKVGFGINYIITTEGIFQKGGTKGFKKFTKFSQIKDFDSESGRIGIIWNFFTCIYKRNVETK